MLNIIIIYIIWVIKYYILSLIHVFLFFLCIFNCCIFLKVYKQFSQLYTLLHGVFEFKCLFKSEFE